MPDGDGLLHEMDGAEPLVEYAVLLRAHIVLGPGQEAEARTLVAQSVQKGREKNPGSRIYLDIGPADRVEIYRQNDVARRLSRQSKTGRTRSTT